MVGIFTSAHFSSLLAQFLLIPVDHCLVEVVNEGDLFEEETDRGSGGFGSTGVK